MGSEPNSLHDRSRNVSKTDSQTIGDQVSDEILDELKPDKCERNPNKLDEDADPKDKLRRIRNARED